MRESLDEEYNWLPEALWVDGRRATMQELYAADPNGKERDMDELMSQRGHPLRQGIKAAFEQRVALKGRQMEEESEKLVRHHIPDGLSPEQELIYLRLKEENHTEDYNNRIKTAVTSMYFFFFFEGVLPLCFVASNRGKKLYLRERVQGHSNLSKKNLHMNKKKTTFSFIAMIV